MKLTRRNVLKSAAGAAALSAAALPAQAHMASPRFEGADTPKIALGLDAAGGAFNLNPNATATNALSDEAGGRRIRQLGVNYVLSGLGGIPWDEARLRDIMARLQKQGLTLGNLMISGFNNAVYNRPGKDEDIEKVIQSIRAAGKVGLPVVEYNWYIHRAMEGYFEETGRAGSGWTGFDYDRMKNLPPLEAEGKQTLDEAWTNITEFLKAVW